MKKVLLIATMLFCGMLQAQQPTIINPEVIKTLNVSGQHLADAGTMKTWSIITAALSMGCFYLDAKATEKDGAIYKIGAGAFGITSMGLMIGSNIKITIAGKKLKQLKLQ